MGYNDRLTKPVDTDNDFEKQKANPQLLHFSPN
jgi:hypothetical protein